jgi:hypothetical protein
MITASERAKTVHASDRSATVTSQTNLSLRYFELYMKLTQNEDGVRVPHFICKTTAPLLLILVLGSPLKVVKVRHISFWLLWFTKVPTLREIYNYSENK